LLVIKVGGSALSDKATGKMHTRQVASNLAKELGNEKAVLILGAGFVGHTLAKKYGLRRLSNNQKEWALLKHAVDKVENSFVELLVNYGLAPFPLSLPSLFTLHNGSISWFNGKIIRGYLEKGFLPVLHSDAPLDVKLGVSILSGDKAAVEIANYLGADIVFGTDVDGLLDKNRKVIKAISKAEAAKLDFWKVNDVSGGMENKINEALKAKGKVYIINLRKPGMLKAVIAGKNPGTLLF